MSVTLVAALAIPATAEVVYTQVNASFSVGGYYAIDLNHDGVADFSLRSPILQGLCQSGDQDLWSLTVTPASGNSVAVMSGQPNSGLAAALPNNVAVNATEVYSTATSVMAELQWGYCGSYSLGQWWGIPSGYLALQFRAPDGTIHYGWAKVSTAAYVDRYGVVHSTTVVWGYAYETIAGQAIMTGQTSGD
jgi:hypothetical protein